MKQVDAVRQFFPKSMASNVDRRDKRMAGHLQWLADQGNDVLVFVALGHVEGIRQYLDGERQLQDEYITEPTFADEANIGHN